MTKPGLLLAQKGGFANIAHFHLGEHSLAASTTMFGVLPGSCGVNSNNHKKKKQHI